MVAGSPLQVEVAAFAGAAAATEGQAGREQRRAAQSQALLEGVDAHFCSFVR